MVIHKTTIVNDIDYDYKKKDALKTTQYPAQSL